MPYTFEFEDGRVREWHLTADGAESRVVEDYRPSLFVTGPDDALADLQERLEHDPKVRETARERRFASLHEYHDDDPTRALRVDAERVGEVRTLAREIRALHERDAHAPGTFRLFDVDVSPGYRYCLDRGIDPTPDPPDRELRTLEIEIDERALADRDVSTLRIDGDEVTGDPGDVCWSLHRRLEREDPDVLVLSHADLVPTLDAAAADAGLETFHLGRRPGWTRLAGESTYESYGRVGHSPARYRVPGRAIVDTSNSFLWHQSGLAGLLYMVGRSRKPLQEAAWASIGTVLTAMQIDRARREGVLAPWNKWEPERFKDVSTLHAADRGGFTFAPEVGFHEGVFEIDFASLYPRIICRHNVSPETVDCDCSGGERVPGLEYRTCEDRGFLPGVLKPLLDDRAKYKRKLADDPPDEEAARLRARSGAIKWVLVSCFGYQGYRNAKFGRIECHEAINAHAREILLRSKERLEDAGWRVVHGIVDSLWVTPRDEEPEPLSAVTSAISREIGIELERDGRYEWVCFVPRRDATLGDSSRSRGGADAGDASADAGNTPTDSLSSAPSSAPAGALTKYFGKRTDGDYKFRGLEVRQRSTPAFVAECQREFVAVLDSERDPEAVCDRLGRRLGDLRRSAGDDRRRSNANGNGRSNANGDCRPDANDDGSSGIDPADLAITKRVSKPLEAYRQETHTVGALRRYEAHGVERHPGQSVTYVVVDDDARRTRERVRLAFELEGEDGDAVDGENACDADYYADLLVRACESVVSPLGWDRARIRRYLADGRTVRLSTFVD